MLDNIVTENCMAAMPIEILADAKISNKHNKHGDDKIIQISTNSIYQQCAGGAPATKTNKTKTILNWLKNTTTTTTNNNNNLNATNYKTKNFVKSDKLCSQHNQIDTTNCTCPKTKKLNSTTCHKETKSLTTLPTTKLIITKEDDTLKEYRGVQTLKHFWNKRITANRESALRVKGSKQQQFTKSVSCLVNAIDNTGEPPPPLSSSYSSPSSTLFREKELLKARKLRALSLHDCSRNSPDFDEVSLSDIEVQKHLEKDNFYKYKTAEQASKLRQLCEHSTNRKLSNGIVLSVGQKAERFDWLRRHDKFIRKKSIELTTTTICPAVQITKDTKLNDNSEQFIANNDATNNNNINIINENEMQTQDLQQQDSAFLATAAIGQNIAEIGNTNHSSETSTPTLTAKNSPQHAVSRRKSTARKDSATTLASASSFSRDSSTTSLAASTNSHRTVVKRNSSARKYSFKTHTRSYHVPRKMHTNKDTVGGGTGIVVNSSNSLVAKLTQQFNEIIQQDKTLLAEIKRKNGVLMTHKGHVYKVVDTSSLNRNPTPTNNRNDLKEHEVEGVEARSSNGPSTVQKNIKKFESESRGLKPKVPLKSIQVLRKSNELVTNKTITSARFNASRTVNNNKKDIETKTDIKPQTLPLSTTLEIVKEEVKTPIESNEIKNVTEACNENKATTSFPMEEISTQDEFLAVLPPKIDSVIYKSIKKSKQKKAEKIEKIKENRENTQTPNDNCFIPRDSSNSAEEQQEENKNDIKVEHLETQIENKETKTQCCSDDGNTLQKISANSCANDKEYIEINADNSTDKPLKTCKIDATPSLFEEMKNDTKIIENSTSPEPSEDEDKKKRKHKYAKIYEKLRFFTPFSHSNKKQKLTPTSPNSIDPFQLNEMENSSDLTKSEEKTKLKLLKSGEYTPMSSSTPKKEFLPADDVYSIMYDPEAKLRDALEQVDKRLQNLSSHDNGNEKILESDDYGQPLIPNSSFLHQVKDITPKSSIVLQAVNVTLVNAIEGEQMIMEQKDIQTEQTEKNCEQQQDEHEHEHETNVNSFPPLLPPKKTADKEAAAAEEEEPFYEPIYIDKIIEIKTEHSYNNKELVEINNSNSSTENSLNIEEDIYQTVEEAKNDYDHMNAKKPPKTIKNIDSDLDGYEPIENPDDLILLTNCINDTLPKLPPSIHFDGYEEYTPIVEMTPLVATTSGVRKVTDELPDLPKTKRVLPKSPKPCRSAPKPPIHRLQSAGEDSADEENIYDTIKSSHCYETLQSVGNNTIQNSPPLLRTKNSDCVSLSSNCYESISQYKRINIVGHHSHHSSSSNGSTLTISSENKTNSLYEDSLISSLHYSSKRIYRFNTPTHIEIRKSTADRKNLNGYVDGSIGRLTDTSDEWTDVTDNENADMESKPQFIIVRERSKVHKSPDWSRRVRDKRQRKSKSCIEDDDPDHFYEQLSPLAFTKRHSLLDQTRTSSLKRNEDAIRVSKRGKQMSYSAHALGQHISDDSFDSDTDDYYESEHFKNSHNDSGVDIRNTKLPDPPSSSNQMYSFVKKFKNFIVNKKSPNSSKHSGSQQKIYDSSSQFYAGGQYEEKPQLTSSSSSTLQVTETKELSTSEKNLILAQSTMSTQHPINTSTTPRKSKSGKSLRSRLRKSLVGFDNKQLSTITPTRSTFYIEDPANDDSNGQLDSGFSEKALSGELATSTASPSADTQKLSTLGRKSKKEAKLANSQRRRTTIGIRPHEPPPPPPPDNNSKTRRQSNTSWYAECGVFKNGSTNIVCDDSNVLNSQNNSSVGSIAAGSTWYEEAGLYQTSGMSVASSSGSSGVSTSNEAGPADEMSHSMFSNEPLYQIYSAAKLEAISRDMQDENSTDGYEEIGDRLKNGNATEAVRKSLRPSALQLVEPKSGPERTLWSQIPEVINSYILPTMTPRERALMEAKFEIITSEASYLKSLNLLRTHYMNHPVFRDQNVVNSRDRKFLFSHIVPVHECSEKLLTELESCWQDNIMLIGLSKRIYTVAERHFHVYVGFCEHQGRMDRTLKRLRESKGLFAQNLELLESSPACCGLNLHSFLMLPMQRITRLPLLIDAVFSKCHPNDDEYENWKMCLAIMNKIVTQCNEAANKSEQAYEIERISSQLEFNPSLIRPLAIAPAGVLAPGTKPRYLVKKGELTHLVWRGDDAKLTFGKKFSKTSIFAFLFSDLLVLTKRKAEEQFSVFDYCPRNMLTITSGDSLPQLPTKDLNSQTSKNLILMTLLENHERKTVELLLSCPSVSEQERWLQAMRPPESETPGEKLYEQWDCPQVIAKHAYENNEPDVLNLDVGDVVNVTRKLPDGWYKGERIRDGAVGWFPGSYTEEVNSVHVRARNLKQRHRLLTFTATYLESQKRNK